jgi:hypothetical protein
MSARADRLYELLPAVYRLRDAEHGSPLRALLGIVQAEHDRIEDNIAELYESWFVETAPEWVLPYIGDVVGNRLLAPVSHSRRADIARTISYRRRKGTLPMLEEMARHVTGWGVNAVEFMQLLGWTQNVNHVRYSPHDPVVRAHPLAVERVGTVDVRNRDALDRLDGAFDRAAHTVDVRAPARPPYRHGAKPRSRAQEGWYGPRRVGLFLWRLASFPLEDMPARRADAPNEHGWHFSPLGAPIPLFARVRPERDPGDVAREVHVPHPIRRIAFRADLHDYHDRFLPLPPERRPAVSEWFGPGRSIDIIVDSDVVPVERVLCKDLGDWARPPAGRVAVDVARGRIAFAAGEEPDEVRVAFAYGFSAAMGGGPYDRRQTLDDTLDAEWSSIVAKNSSVQTLQDALAAWESAGRPNGIIEIADSDIYGGDVRIELPAGGSLTIQAADGRLPSVRLVGDMRVEAVAGRARLALNGLLIEGAVRLDGEVDFDVAHCTLVPGRMLTDDGDPWFVDRDSLVVESDGEQTPDVRMRWCIVGPIRLPETARGLALHDCIVQAFPVGGVPRPAIAATDDGDVPGPATVIDRSTIFGTVHVRELIRASESLFTAHVETQRIQAGCVRFSYVPPGSRTPRRYHCQPDRALDGIEDAAERARVRARIVPSFQSIRYSDPAYAQLRLEAAVEILTGAENGSEMGVFCALDQPLRAANLRIRLEEYLPFGLEAALIFAT